MKKKTQEHCMWYQHLSVRVIHSIQICLIKKGHYSKKYSFKSYAPGTAAVSYHDE